MLKRTALHITICISILLTLNTYANTQDNCFSEAPDQMTMNQCALSDYQKVEAELHRVIAEITDLYRDDEKFIAALVESQEHWSKQLELDLIMRFPEGDSRIEYGSIFPVCYQSVRSALTQSRIKYLQEWTTGHEKGEMCGGSIMHEYYINQDN